MAFPVTINGRTYTLADFEGTNYVDGFPDALEDFVTQAGDIYNSTSSSSVAIGTGSKTFTVADSGKPYQAGTPLRIADAAAPETNFMDCIVTSYSGTTLVVDAFGFAGSGTKSSWTVNIGGAKTVDGTLAVAQGGTGATTTAAAATNLGLGTGDSPEFAGLTLTGDASFGDNDKAIFGASNDLQIFHDGSNSYINENGSGLLYIGGSDKVQIYDPTFTVQSAQFDTNGPVRLFYNGGEKLATTSTGIDVTGTLTADGLTVDGTSDLNGTITVGTTYTTNITGNDIQFLRNNGASYIAQRGGYPLAFQTNDGSDRTRLNIEANGDISFYEDTGTTKKFHWDASAESLGIGTTSPQKAIEIRTADTGANEMLRLTNIQARETGGGPKIGFAPNLDFVSGNLIGASIAAINPDGDVANKIALVFGTGQGGTESERMRLDHTGHLIVPEGITLGTAVGTYAAANTLDDYEEGTFTPEFIAATTSDFTHSTAFGSYTKIGRLVVVHITLGINSKGTSSGALRVGGLPFTVANLLTGTNVESAATFNFWSGVSSGIYGLAGNATESTTYVAVTQIASATTDTVSSLQASDIDADFQIRMTMTYQTS